MSSVFSKSSAFSKRLLLLACITVSVSASVCAMAQVEGDSKKNPSQEAFVFDRIYDLVRYEDDGTGSRETTAVIRVQSQAGVQALGQLVLGYSSATESLEVDYVRVRKPNGQVIETQVANAQDFAPDVLRQAPTYSDYRERHVSIANLQAGDTLEYHMRKSAHRRTMWWYTGVAKVAGRIVAEAEVGAMIVDA